MNGLHFTFRISAAPVHKYKGRKGSRRPGQFQNSTSAAMTVAYRAFRLQLYACVPVGSSSTANKWILETPPLGLVAGVSTLLCPSSALTPVQPYGSNEPEECLTTKRTQGRPRQAGLSCSWCCVSCCRHTSSTNDTKCKLTVPI